MDLPRGMRDIEPKESSTIEYIRQKFIETSNLFGFQFMEPSPIELVSVIETKSGPSIRNEIYYFTDKGDREVALRFDFTIGITRYAVSQKSMKLPAKFSTFGGVWRYDEPQKGRYRFFHQWDVEIYGEPNIESDAEIIDFTSKFFTNLKLENIVVDICDRELIESYIKDIFKSDSNIVSDILRAVDKSQKKRKQEIIKEYQEKGYSVSNLEKVLEFAQIKGTPQEIEKKIDVHKLTNWNKVLQLFESLENRGVRDIRINFGIVRGLDYYSGIVFEVFDSSSDLGALVGGGRYDTLTKAFGRSDLGATGAAGGVERIAHSLELQKINIHGDGSHVWVVSVNEDMKKVAISIASQLRLKGIATEVDLTGKSLRKQMEMASSSKHVIIAAPKEYADNLVIIRNMEDGSEKQVKIESVLSNPRSSLQL
ncbi:MAG: histidine--tRNA ligase [Thaumarchaeota archaeon 13_1_40CM_38_12]|nr:MAG: histidine--tRNA ligase [Thaumarchaeota archaeon 13_1_40CM_38_12]OLC33327.1 MAG: histidine--tRNA ligase [Thaumarchaeota archaeon 13_1_40CM_4_38_7]OLD29212.1 MAG: histidine--tRNA ligase [Thaumarchaeota archaeon 13_1_40CM_2_39_7]